MNIESSASFDIVPYGSSVHYIGIPVGAVITDIVSEANMKTQLITEGDSIRVDTFIEGHTCSVVFQYETITQTEQLALNVISGQMTAVLSNDEILLKTLSINNVLYHIVAQLSENQLLSNKLYKLGL